jgi:hypothetical protein
MFERQTHRLFTLTWLWLCLIASSGTSAEDAKPTPKPEPTRELVIRSQGGEKAWDASAADVEKVLHSAAGELWKHFPAHKLHPIHVQPRGGPIVLFQRGGKGEYIVRLDTGGTYWSQYSFQFAHEFTHILCGYREGDTSNLWFEESLCELGSLYVLRQMAQTWKTKPPYDHWKSYAPRLAEYAADRIKAAPLPEKTTLAQWYAEHAAALKKDATQRERNSVVAGALLDLFEKSPQSWEAVAYVNAKKGKAERSFEQYLADWHTAAPQGHRAFIRDVALRFGIKLVEPAPAP